MKQSSAMSDERPSDDAALIARMVEIADRDDTTGLATDALREGSERLTVLNAELSERDKEVERLRSEATRPLIGIANRTAQEVFDIMSARILAALPTPSRGER
jgi:hypothetical protein